MRYDIRNRYNLNIVVEYRAVKSPSGLAFVQHGFSGFKEEPHIAAIAEVFRKHDISTVTFDASNAFGESAGKLEDARLGKHAQDLEDVIAWAKGQDWYAEPFFLAGHSLGGASVLSYATQFPDQVKGLAPLSTVVSGELLIEACKRHTPDDWSELKDRGYIMKQSSLRPEKTGKRMMEYYIEACDHDFLNTVVLFYVII